MTLVYPPLGNNNPLSEMSLTVPNEAVRGMRFDNGQWILYVSDPEPMSVSKFKLTREVLMAAAEYLYRDFPPVTPLTAENGQDLLAWLLTEKSVRVELLVSEGLPAMFTGPKTTGPGPNLGMKGPDVTR